MPAWFCLQVGSYCLKILPPDQNKYFMFYFISFFYLFFKTLFSQTYQSQFPVPPLLTHLSPSTHLTPVHISERIKLPMASQQSLFISFSKTSLFLCVFVSKCVQHGIHVDSRGPLGGVCFLFPPLTGFWFTAHICGECEANAFTFWTILLTLYNTFLIIRFWINI